jgi:acetyltransferase-like isoleucine patch superfamily enzyme
MKMENLAEVIKRGDKRVFCGRHTMPTKTTVSFYTENERIELGNFCHFAFQTYLIPGGIHRPDLVTIALIRETLGTECPVDEIISKGPIVFGSDVVVSTRATVLSNVKVGDGAIIGAGSVVTKDVEPYTIVAGNPARPIKKRFSDVHIEQLLKIKWWNWPDNEIRQAADKLYSPDVDGFISYAKKLKERGKVE